MFICLLSENYAYFWNYFLSSFYQKKKKKDKNRRKKLSIIWKNCYQLHVYELIIIDYLMKIFIFSYLGFFFYILKQKFFISIKKKTNRQWMSFIWINNILEFKTKKACVPGFEPRTPRIERGALPLSYTQNITIFPIVKYFKLLLKLQKYQNIEKKKWSYWGSNPGPPRY